MLKIGVPVLLNLADAANAMAHRNIFDAVRVAYVIKEIAKNEKIDAEVADKVAEKIIGVYECLVKERATYDIRWGEIEKGKIKPEPKTPQKAVEVQEKTLIEALGELRAARAVPLLERILCNNAEKTYHRVLAAEALGKIGGEEAKRILERLAVEEKNKEVQKEAMHCLRKICMGATREVEILLDFIHIVGKHTGCEHFKDRFEEVAFLVENLLRKNEEIAILFATKIAWLERRLIEIGDETAKKVLMAIGTENALQFVLDELKERLNKLQKKKERMEVYLVDGPNLTLFTNKYKEHYNKIQKTKKEIREVEHILEAEKDAKKEVERIKEDLAKLDLPIPKELRNNASARVQLKQLEKNGELNKLKNMKT